MAEINLEEIRKLVKNYSNWEEEGCQSPDVILNINLSTKNQRNKDMFDPSLVNKTLTFESHEVTLV